MGVGEEAGAVASLGPYSPIRRRCEVASVRGVRSLGSISPTAPYTVIAGGWPLATRSVGGGRGNGPEHLTPQTHATSHLQ